MIRFKKHPWRAATDVPRNGSTIDPRRIRAARQALERQREREGLFATCVAAPDDAAAVERLASLNSAQEQRIKDDRLARAASWRRCRRALRAMPEDIRDTLLFRWNQSDAPADPEYLADRIWHTCHPLACAIIAASWRNRDYVLDREAPWMRELVRRVRESVA